MVWQGWYEWLQGDTELAHRYWQHSVTSAATLGMIYDQGLAHEYLALHSKAKHSNQRQQHLQRAYDAYQQAEALEDCRRISGLL